MATETHVCAYAVAGPGGEPFFKCQRTETRIFGTRDGGWLALCAAHSDWATALGCRP